ncbi:MAG TPA: patatin-like phospholipase family protein [Bacteroidales bacterium]|nr:patatin-like phospholipase family protein [Bacteroidales bacterium]
MSDPKTLSNLKVNLFQNIALTISGGGYRASAFGLGVLSYLNHTPFQEKPLLESVKGLSTVSGGTLTGATYALYMAKGNKFPDFYKDFYHILDEDIILKTAFDKFSADEVWKTSHKRRSLINAFALAYEEILTNGAFREIKNGDKSHLEDICFNATDLSFGLAFRFQTTGDFGNYRLKNRILDPLIGEIKIADAIAASSCFPLGFEPIVFPDDFFSHSSSLYTNLKMEPNFIHGVGLMDGGIVDNQGIGSIMKADARRKKSRKTFDLIMVCDVGSYFMDPWKASSNADVFQNKPISLKKIFTRTRKSINQLKLLYVTLFIGLIILITGFQTIQSKWAWIAIGAVGFAWLCSTLIMIFSRKLKQVIIENLLRIGKMVPGFLKPKLTIFYDLQLSLMKIMLEERYTSAVTMINDIFLKQIRRLNYDLFYKDENLQNRRITSLIYQLTKEQFLKGESDEIRKEEKEDFIENPGEKIFSSAKIAREMGTTLWFTEKDKEVSRLKNLVSCGQFTSCYNLLKYCIELKKSGSAVDNALLDQMIGVFHSDWIKFINDPFWLHDETKISQGT